MGGSLPGSTPAGDDLGLDVQFKILDRPSATIFEKELIQMGSIASGRYLEIGVDGIRMYIDQNLMIDIQSDGDIFVGNTSSGEYVKISSAAVELYSGGTKLVDIQSDGDLFVGEVASGDYVKVSGDGVETYANGTLLINADPSEDVYVGDTDGGEYVKVTGSGIEMFAGGDKKLQMQNDGDVFIGEDLSTAGGTYFAIFANNQTYNSESVSAGDMLIGDNSNNKANIFWDKSAGRLYFRGGQSEEAYVDTDGAIVAGDGDVILDSAGITLVGGQGNTNLLKFKDDDDQIAYLRANVDGSTTKTALYSKGKDSSHHEATLTLEANTDDGNAHAGAAEVTLLLDTAQDKIMAYAEQVWGFKVLRFVSMTTTQRNALSAANGMLIYNSTTNKFQGRAGSAWVDLH